MAGAGQFSRRLHLIRDEIHDLIDEVAARGGREIDLSWESVRDHHLHYLARRIPDLLALNLSDCRQITDAGLSHL